MKGRTKFCMAGMCVVLIAVFSLAIAAAAQMESGKLHWMLKINETRGPLRSADMSPPSGNAALSEILAGPTNGSDNGYLIYTRMAPGAHGPDLFTLPVEDDYVVLSGKMTIQIGTDKFVAEPYTGVVIPPNTPHAFWNAESGPETNFEVISSGHPETDLSRNLMSMLKPAKATKVENADKCIRKFHVLEPSELKHTLNGQTWTAVAQNSPFQVRLDSPPEGAGNTTPHVHVFEQVYFGTEGEMDVMYGLKHYTVKKGDIIIIQPGVVHDNAAISSVERHITLLLPEPPAGSGAFDIEFEMVPPKPAATTPK